MDALTRRVYERSALEWVAARKPRALEDGRLRSFARRVRRGGRVADLGCGPGWYAGALAAAGLRATALDVAAAMLASVPRHAAGVPRVQADLVALPFARQTFDGAWAANSYCHVPAAEMPLALAELHAALRPGAAVDLTLPVLAGPFAEAGADVANGIVERRLENGELAGRLFTAVTPRRGRALLAGAGFEGIRVAGLSFSGNFWLRLTARRGRTLPDLVRPGLRLLVCGLNPSLYSADRGVAFARPGNRFWAAARAAGLVARERDGGDALRLGIGLTDVVKRATAAADEVETGEYRRGFTRLRQLVRAYEPASVCFVGLDGWRRAVDRRAQSGWVDGGFAGRPAYLMPSTSGRNARLPLDDLAAHLRAAAEPPPRGAVTADR